jgi:hypothetical protein
VSGISKARRDGITETRGAPVPLRTALDRALAALVSVPGHWALAALALGVVMYRVASFERDLMYGFLVDDAYISARHALNFVKGYGLNFNPHQRVEGYTNFLFTALMILPHWLNLPLEPFVRALGILAALGSIVLAVALSRPILGKACALILGAALVLDPRFVFFAVWGLETGFACLPCLLGYFLLFRGRYALAGVAFAAALLTRMDLAVVVAPAFAYALFDLVQSRPESGIVRGLARLLLPIAGIFGIYFLSRWYYYGWLLPNTFYAKVGSPSHAWHRGILYIQDCFGTMGLSSLSSAALAAWAVCIALCVPLARRQKSEFAQALTLAAAAGFYLLYTVMVGGDHFQERFIYHVFALVLIACLAPWALLARLAASWLPRGQRVMGAAVALVCILFAQALARSPHHFGQAHAVGAWRSLAEYLKQHAPPGAVLATDAAGVLPYYSGLRTIDILGLTDPVIAHREVPNLGSGVAGHEKSDPEYVVSKQPEYIATWLDPDGYAGRGFGHLASFQEQYKLAALVRIDQPNASPERVLPFANVPKRSELIALHDGHGSVPGLYQWALYVRREELDYRNMDVRDFRSNLPGFTPNPNYIVSAPKGHVPAHIMYGPFVKFSEGEHLGYVTIKTGRADDVDPRQRLCGFDVFNGQRTITEMPILVGEARDATVDFPFAFEVTAEESTKPYEFRLYCWGLADVTVESVSVR